MAAIPDRRFQIGPVSTAQGKAWQCPAESKSRDGIFRQENAVGQ
jgi:hypothetical protein